MEMTSVRVLLGGVAILGLFSAAAMLATNFQIYEVSAGDYADTMWPGTAPTVTWNENFTAKPSNVVVKNGVTTSTVLTNAFSTWANATAPGTSSLATNVQFSFGTASASLPNDPTLDCKNVVGFSDPNGGDFPTGVIAFAMITTTPSGFIPGSNCPTYTTPCPIANCIVDVDIMFNPSETFATASAGASQFDLQSVATHEIGHLLGLDHSNIAHAVMYPYGDTSMIGVHTALSTDDIVGVGHLYPGPANPDSSGIEGTVKLNGGGIYAADVQAVDATTGNVVTETLTDPSGNYHLLVYDGTYYVYVQSLAPGLSNGPTTISNFTGQAGYGGNNVGNIPANPADYTGKFY
jgi:hypothetical protein